MIFNCPSRMPNKRVSQIACACPAVQKYHWFQKAVWMDEKEVYTQDELRDLALEYIARDDDEIIEAQVHYD